MTATLAQTSHRFSLQTSKSQRITAYGSRIDARSDVFPVLKGMSLSILTLNPGAFREPHWHPNAHELGLCLEGQGLVTVFSPGNSHDTFIIGPNDLAFIPMGALHQIENIGDKPLKMAVCFNHESADDLELSSSVGIMSERVLGATVGLQPSFFGNFKKGTDSVFIGHRSKKPDLVPSYQTNRYKLDLMGMRPQVDTAGGWARMGQGATLPTLDGLALYLLDLKENGVREPHWHPNAHELNYLISGSAHLKLLSPGGHVDTFDMVAGDISFLPQGYFHHIENTSKDDAVFAVFFNNRFPSDMGLSGSLGAFPNDILATLFGVTTADLKDLPKLQEDLLVVKGAG